ncbi:MAG: PAS domain S-box protein [Bacteroidota bacterium]
MIIASQIVVGVLKDTSDEFLVEYNEMNVMQELKLSLYQLLLQTSKFTLSQNSNEHESFKILIHQTSDKLSHCNQVITKSHDTDILVAFYARLHNIKNLGEELFNLTPEAKNTRHEEILQKINREINISINQINIILVETKHETASYVETSKTVFKHSSLTIFILGFIIIIIIIVAGLNFINNLTKPIHDFVETTKRIISGDRGIKVKIDTGDEFSILANSFNLMLESLENTTVSKSYLDNILKNMFDSLIVTDNTLKIRSVNQSAANLLGRQKKWFDGKPLEVIFGEKRIDTEGQLLNEKEIKAKQKSITKRNKFIHSSGKIIPALISCSILRTNSGESDGLIIVGHDLTIKKEIEQKLENSRKERQIDINEAQEEERIRIAIDLHDGLGQMLTAVSYTTQEFQSLDLSNLNKRELLVSKIQEQINRAIRESKNLAHNLIPIVLKDFGLKVAINDLIERANDMYDIQFRFNSFDFNERIDVKLEKALYRICQESLNNIVKHSKAKNANYQIFKQDDLIILVIDDDGVGFDINSPEWKSNKGIGLVSMRERVSAFGGTFSIDSQIGNGTEIIIEIPCRKKKKKYGTS